MTWFYKDKPFTSEDYEEHVKNGVCGFVYQITNLSNQMSYIGKKTFTSTRSKPPLKGKTRKRKVISESDWQSYYGSNEELKSLVAEANDSSLFYREILRLCYTKGEMSYFEIKYQLENDVLLYPNKYYNGFVGGKISRSHLKRLIEETNGRTC